MAEVFAGVGLVAAITQLIELGCQVLTRLDEFRSGQVPKSFRRLQINLGVLLQALERTKTAIDTGHASDADSNALQPAIDDCRLQIETLDYLLAKSLPKPGEPRRIFEMIMKAILSLTRERKVNGIRNELDRCMLALTHHNVATLLVLAGRDHNTGFSRNTSSAALDRLSTRLSGSPCYTFERSPSFYPEQYSVVGLFSNPLFVVAMKQKNDFTHQYYLMFSQSPRCWKRVIITATFRRIRNASTLLQVLSPDNLEGSFKELPNAVSTALKTALARVQLFGSVTSVSVPLIEDESGRIVHESHQVESTEDCEEVKMLKEADILHKIKLMGCHTFKESEVQVVSRLSSSYFAVRVGDQEYIERKLSFAGAGGDGENGICTFMDDLKLFNSLRGCHGVSQLAGAVLDDARLHLKSYLYEAPMIFMVNQLFYFANLRNETIPWPVRELWAAQIAQAIANVHSKGFIMGYLDRSNVGLRADGSATLMRLQTSKRYLGHSTSGSIPPELRGAHIGKEQCLDDRTDIFQLGMLLWLLAEHNGSVTGSRCSRNACTSVPRYKCTAAHSDPIDLPPSIGHGVPAYFSSIISRCRSPDPRARPTAREIVAEISSSQGRQHIREFPQDTLNILNAYHEAIGMGSFTVHCDECGGWCPEDHYHCYACRCGNFDLCVHCVEAQGLHCYVPEHRLVKRVSSKSGGYVQVSC